ncbi:multidrug efflux SMR transporter [Paenibacillus sp. W2I17]|uniref:DMT family transporter n=1 Tax=Paenibacillus sp. W2I17 TaxID=3042311 RepID=UPI00277E3F8F|nr:multidrug resistance protein EbrB [Paenibacillus sp. W2I17]
MKQGFMFLALAIIFEIFATTMLKLSSGFTILLPTIAFIVAMGGSFVWLSKSLRTLPLSLAYAIWSGVGTALTAVIGIIIWDEHFGLFTGVGLILIIGGVVLLNTAKKTGKEASPSS